MGMSTADSLTAALDEAASQARAGLAGRAKLPVVFDAGGWADPKAIPAAGPANLDARAARAHAAVGTDTTGAGA